MMTRSPVESSALDTNSDGCRLMIGDNGVTHPCKKISRYANGVDSLIKLLHRLMLEKWVYTRQHKLFDRNSHQ